MDAYIGVDTSCYTTSVACVDERGIVRDERTVLSVRSGERGLRQSDGLFQHVRNLESLMPALFAAIEGRQVRAIAVSARPRAEEGSYMPVFLAGQTAAASAAAALGVPLYRVSHQEGHVRAALFGNEALRGQAFLGMHISGGTTEIFRVDKAGEIALLGGTSDLHAGQFVDRLGVSMGLPFPAGKGMEKLAAAHTGGDEIKLPAIVEGYTCSFSGVETRAQALIAGGAPKEAVAYAAYDCMARTFHKMLAHAVRETGLDTALLAGGVASSGLLRALLRERCEKRGGAALHFGEPALSSDNAVGVALLCMDRFKGEG